MNERSEQTEERSDEVKNTISVLAMVGTMFASVGLGCSSYDFGSQGQAIYDYHQASGAAGSTAGSGG